MDDRRPCDPRQALARDIGLPHCGPPRAVARGLTVRPVICCSRLKPSGIMPARRSAAAVRARGRHLTG